MTDHESFEAAIKAAAWDDDLPRLVFADWLDEHGEHEEADRQRAYVPAFRFLADFTSYCYKGQVQDLERVLAEIDEWRQDVEKDGDICFSNTSDPQRLRDEDTRTEFWRCFAVVTGVVAPESLREEEYYRCAC